MWYSPRVLRRGILAGSAVFITATFATPAVADGAAESFSTPVLSAGQLVQAALARNPGIAEAQAATEVAGAHTESADALPDPMVSYAIAPNTTGYPGQGLNKSLQISQSFPWPGTLDLRSETAKAELESVEQQFADVRLQLASQARSLYAQWYYVYQARAINVDNQALLTRLESVAETEYAAGQAPEQDVLQAQVESIHLQHQALELERERRNLQAQIDGLLNLDPSTPVPPPADIPPPQTLPDYAALQLFALNQYPGLESLNAEVNAAKDRVNLAGKDSAPSFTLMAGYNSLWDPADKRLIVGVSFNVPFGTNHRGETDEANARLRQTEARLADARAQLLSDLDQAYATAMQYEHTIGLYTGKLLPLAGLNLKAAEADYRSGSGDFLKLITAEQQLLTTKLELADARAGFYTQLASLDYQTGGALFQHPLSATPEKDAHP